MVIETPFDYHDDEQNHGSYQYVLLKDIVNAVMQEALEDDNILKNIRRNTIIRVAKNGIRELNRNAVKDVLAMEITVPDSLYFALPHDFVSYVRVSLVVTDEVTDSFRLQPLDVNGNINIADGYLQDNDWEILFDEDGYILKADSSNTYNRPYKKYTFCSSSRYIGTSTLNTAKLSKYGEFKIDERRGKIVFSSELADKDIVMEYLSDGLSFDTYSEEAIKIHKDALQALKDYIYFGCIEHRQNVSYTEKQRALLRFKTTRHEARLNRSKFDLLQIRRAMNLLTKNI